MRVAALGSQICNLGVGLGLPWTLSLLAHGEIAISDSQHLRVAAALQAGNVLLLSAMLLGPALLHAQPKAVLTRRKGLVSFAAYLAIVVSFALCATLT